MSELQLGLLVIGVVVVIGVLVYNKLQERKLRREAGDAFGSRHEDVLMGHADTSDTARPVAGPVERLEPTFAPLPQEPEQAGGMLDSGIDFIASLKLDKAVHGEAIAGAIADCQANPAKPVNWECYNRQTANWEPLAAAGEYETLRTGLQLADRNGAVGDQDLADFTAMVQSVASVLGANSAFPDGAMALQRARELDALCAEVDVQIGLNVVTRSGGAPGTRIRALAEAQGFTLERDGKFHRRDDAGLDLFILCNMEPTAFTPEGMKTFSTKGLTLLLDVARAPGGIAAFDRLAEFARSLADALSAAIVDDNGRPLDDTALGKIRGQLQDLHTKMEKQGIPAGGSLALRLFS